MKVGAEPRKVATAALLMAVAGYLMYSNIFSDQQGPSAPRPAAAPTAASLIPSPPPGSTGSAPMTPNIARDRQRDRRILGQQEFRPTLKRKPEESADPMSFDPTLRLDLLARLQQVKLDGGDRSLFEFSQTPLPKTPEPKILPKPVAMNPLASKPADTPAEAGEVKEAVKPPPPPIPLKFFGYTNPKPGSKRAFFLNGEDILMAAEGELMQNRYKVVRIGVNSVVVEDTQHKHQQTFVLEEQPAG